MVPGQRAGVGGAGKAGRLSPARAGAGQPCALHRPPGHRGHGPSRRGHGGGAGGLHRGPAWIGKNCRIRQGAYVRANVIAGDGCVLGNSSEFKNCLLFDGAEVPHFNYVGDSVLGYKAHLGAGVICSNLRSDKAEVKVFWGGERLATGLRKFGALVGDGVEVGCQAVLNPGTLLGPGAIVHPGVIWAGTLEGGRTAVNRAIQRGRARVPEQASVRCGRAEFVQGLMLPWGTRRKKPVGSEGMGKVAVVMLAVAMIPAESMPEPGGVSSHVILPGEVANWTL
ncbi:MAG: hypothetical protein HC897_02685 [Thermoanaerobaculia bacterium]|nr:hypothetical protein [Thermoanaerobaculia bacterium]